MVKKSRRKLAEPNTPQPQPNPPSLSGVGLTATAANRPAYDNVNRNTGRIPEARGPFPAAAGMGPGVSEPTGFAAEKISYNAVGNSGTQIFGGYFSEEYLSQLRGRRGAIQWDEMRRSEAQISMLLNAIMNPIKAGNWDIEPYREGDDNLKRHAALMKRILFEDIDFNTFKVESLTVLPFGFSLLEVVHNVVHNHPEFGTYNGLKALAFRSQKTIENWQLEPRTGRLIGVNQYTYSDLGGNEFIPGEFLLVFTHLKEGDNYEGISTLRPMLGAYKRKELYLKLAAIGVERSAIGTPVGTVPPGKEKTLEFTNFQNILQNFTSHEASYLIHPKGWDVNILKVPFDATAIKELLSFENTEFANAVVGNFLALGMNGGGGAYALGSNLGEFFTTGIQSYADLICDAVNNQLIPNLCKLNYGPQIGYPKMKCTGITDKAGKELAETIKFLSDARALDPDQPFKEHVRKQYRFPKTDPATAVPLPAIPAGAAANYPKPNDPVVNPLTGKIEPFQPNQLIDDGQSAQKPKQLSAREQSMQLADKKYVAQFDAQKAKLKTLMQAQLQILFQGLKQAVSKRYNALNGSDKILAAKGVETPGLAAYKSVLRDFLAGVAAQSLRDARKKVPNRKDIKLADVYDALPPYVRKLIDAQSSLVAETQAGDLEKQVFFTFTSSATTSDDIDAILNDVDTSVEPSLEGATGAGMSIDAAAGDAVAHIIQQSAMSFYSDPDVVDAIESYTFTNEDPISDICQELAGTTFSVGDPDLDAYTPPLHHNCKSRLVPNLIGAEDNPDIDRGGVSLSRKALDSITLAEKKRKVRCHEH